MQKILLTDSPMQRANLLINEQNNAQLEVRFFPFQQEWTYSLQWNSVTITGAGLVLSSDLLSQWRHLIPFKLICVAADGLDPMSIDDFSSGRVGLYVSMREENDGK